MRKNILLITCDQFRHDALGLHKAFPIKTPNLDRLAAGGCLFENAYCSYPMCVPSRASIMTGQYSFEHGVYYNDQGWPRGAVTLPGELGDNGYRSVKVGKTHFQPKLRYGGFDKIVGNFDLTHRFVKALAESDKPGWAGVIQRSYNEARAATEYESYEPVVHTEIALRELQKLVDTRECHGDGAVEPFFMWVSYQQPHSPCNPPEPYRSMYPPETLREAVRTAEEIGLFDRMLKRGMTYWTDIDEGTRRSFMSRYLGSISLLDKLIGEILDKLDEQNLTENTMVIFSSDHGDYLGDHHLQQKGFFHDCSAKVPLIIKGPGIAANRKISANVSLIDLLPTALDYATLKQPDRRDPQGKPIYANGLPPHGQSLVQFMDPNAPAPNGDSRVVICETGIYGQGIMLKQGHTKINYYPQSKHWDHFNLRDDPDELNNLGGSEQPPLSKEMQQALKTVLEESGKFKDQWFFFDKVRPMFS